MNRPERVRVTGPPRRTAVNRRPGAGDIDEGTALGTILMDSLLAAQLRLALGVLTVLALSVGSLPLLFHLLPSLADVRLVGIPLAYLLLWVLVFPLLLALGWVYVRRAEANERAFAELVSSTDDRGRQPR